MHGNKMDSESEDEDKMNSETEDEDKMNSEKEDEDKMNSESEDEEKKDSESENKVNVDSETEDEEEMDSESEDEDVEKKFRKLCTRENDEHSLQRNIQSHKVIGMKMKPIPDKSDQKKRKANSIHSNTPTSSIGQLEINENKNKLLTTIKLHTSYTIRNLIRSKLYQTENEVHLIVEDYFGSIFKEDSAKEEDSTMSKKIQPRKKIQPCPMDFKVEKCERSSTTSDKIELFIVPYRILKKQQFVNKEDINHGTATFVYWFEKDGDEGSSSQPAITDIPMYCMLRSGASSTWMKFLKFRNKDFGHSVARSLLDPNRLVSVEMINLLGNNAGSERVIYKKKRFTLFDIMGKVGIMKKYKLHIHPQEEIILDRYNGSEVIAKKIPWEVQVGQLRVPIKERLFKDDNQLSKIFPLLHRYNNSPEKEEWQLVDFWKLIDLKQIPEMIKKMETEFDCCISDDQFIPTMFSRGANLRAEPVEAFGASTDIQLVRKYEGGKSKVILWKTDEPPLQEVMCGNDIKVEDLIRTIKHEEGLNASQYFLRWKGGPFKMEKSIFDHIEVITVTQEGDTIMKLDNQWIEVIPGFETHLITNHKFIHVLREYLVTKGDEHKSFHSGNLLFPLTWNTGNKDDAFNLDHVYKEWLKPDEKAPDTIKDDLIKVLCEEFCIVDKDGKNNLSKEVKLNCSILPNTSLGKKDKKNHLNTLSKMLFASDQITDEMIKEKLFKRKKKEEQSSNVKQIRDALSKTTTVCKKDSDGNLIVHNPYLTEKAVKKLKEITNGTICISRLLQFLRGRVSLEEEDYNELYHLSNCPCHSNGWVFIVGDQILCGTEAIELFDVMAYHEESRVAYMMHIKEKADASATRAACSQVRVCGEEMTRCLTIGMEEDILDLFYKRAVDLQNEEASIHRRLVQDIMLQKFPTKESFNSKLRSARFMVCLALADTTLNGASKWTFLKEANLSKAIELEPSIRMAMVELGYISNKKGTLTQKVVDTAKGQVVNKIGNKIRNQKKADEAYDVMFTAIKPAGLNCSEMREMLQGKYITKTEINSLHEDFYGFSFEKVTLKIMPIPC